MLDNIDLTYKKAKLGEKYIPPKKEWYSGEIELNLGVKKKFPHKTVQMQRNRENILEGTLTLISPDTLNAS